MRVVILADEYMPSGTRAHAKMLHELAIEFKKNGHQPIVITPGKPNQKSLLIKDKFEEIEIWFFKSGATRGKGLIIRLINEWLLTYRAKKAIKNENNNFDLCINYSPTIFFGPLANFFKKKGAYVFLILRDMFPQWIIDKGIIREKSIPYIFLKYYENLNYKTSNCIGVQSEGNLELFKSLYPNYQNVITLINLTSISGSKEGGLNSHLLEELNIQDKLIFFYGGNIGKAQDIKNIIRLVKKMKSHKNVHFLIIGQGDEYEFILNSKIKYSLYNLTIRPSVKQDEYEKILHSVHVGLISLAFEHSAHNFPGKILGYMRSSLPILGSVNPGNDLLNIINDSNAGIVHINGEDNKLLESAKLFAEKSELRNAYGENSYSLMTEKFSVSSAVETILKKMFDEI